MKLTINCELPSLNEYIAAINASRHTGNKLKREAQDAIGWFIRQQRLRPITKPVTIRFLWVTKDRRKDLDNVCAAKKFVLDALVECGILTNDNRKNVCGFTDRFAVDKGNPRVEVEIEEVV